jgi:predicted choloylglycine hydrolase
MIMYEITLTNKAYERGLQQGRAYCLLLQKLQKKCPAWLGGLSQGRVKEILDNMVNALKTISPEMVEELQGISIGSGLSFDDICTVNFVSAIAALGGCTNLISLKTEAGPALAKTSDIGDDYIYYSIQRVEPDQGHKYLAISWVGCLWAELGMNAAGLAVGTSSAPTQLGQIGAGIPTQEYPRVVLERCGTVAEAVAFCQQTPMAGKGLNIALLDAAGNGAVVEKSGTAAAVRYPLTRQQGECPGAALDSVYCANIFLDKDMQGFTELAVPGLQTNLMDNSRQRLVVVDGFLRQNPQPSLQALETLLRTSLQTGGLCQHIYAPMMTHFAYILLPSQHKMVVYEGVSENRLTKKEYLI